MNPNSQPNAPRTIPAHMQETDLFCQNAAEYFEFRERAIEQQLHSTSHEDTLSFDKETHLTRVFDSYLSGENSNYPSLNIDEIELLRNSDQTKVRVLCRIPWTGSESFFMYEPLGDYGLPSAGVTINLNDYYKVISFHYEVAHSELEGDFQKLLMSDVTWLVDSLDDVIGQFKEHESRLRAIIGKALDERIDTVFKIETLMESIEVPRDIFRNKLSVTSTPPAKSDRSPRYRVFRPLLFGQQEGRCRGTNLEILFSESTVDHLIPQDAGGGHRYENLVVLCQPCNNLKDNSTWDEYLQKIEESPSICAGRIPSSLET